jgi:vacuolar-type H+-ATPase subunit E/Vma4
LEESDLQSSDIIDMAIKEADKILLESKTNTESKRTAIQKQLEADIVKIREKVFSTLNIEKKRIDLKAKVELIGEILDVVKSLAKDYRQNSGYNNFLKNAVIEGAGIIDREEIDVFYSAKDENIFSSVFIRGVEKACADLYNKNFSMQFKKIDTSDIGVITQSRDGNLIYDNTFLARFKRKQEEIYMELMREA